MVNHHPAPIRGITLGATSAGIRKLGRKDLLVIRLDDEVKVAGVFTTNQFRAAPVVLAEKFLKGKNPIRALIVNTGFANAGTGDVGMQNALSVCEALGNLISAPVESVLPFSTGVIMEHIPVDRIIAGLPVCLDVQRPDSWGDAASAIMTTDLVEKIASTSAQIGGKKVSITGIAKGSGMIKPNMATMLSFVATDANISQDALNNILKIVTDRTFNCISVDGDTSTNDSFVLMASGNAGNLEITDESSPGYDDFFRAVTSVCEDLAKQIVRDGEGATKFIEILVDQAENEIEAKKVAFAIAHSPLVKTAFFASDPNLGRIISAIGASGIGGLDVKKVTIKMGDLIVASNAGPAPGYSEQRAREIMSSRDIKLHISLGRGTVSSRIWTCDLSYDYVKINAEYRS